jgi:putative membrane protein
MEFSNVPVRFVLAAITVALALPVISSARRNSSPTMPTGKQFITSAAKINLGEIALGKLAEQKGANPAVRDFGKLMVYDHTKLEDQLQDLAKAKGITLPTQPGAREANLQQQLSNESGAPFDQTYIQHMLSGHKQAITDFENEIEHGTNPAFKSYAESGLPLIQDHIRIAEDVAGKMQMSGKYGLEAPSKAINARG